MPSARSEWFSSARTITKGEMFGGDAFWNYYWNLNGLWSLATPEIIDNWVETQLEMFRHTGWTGKRVTRQFSRM